ncbi:hypothetical protein G7046_g7092 [Stylonectria norvegica]|nr:hypothetical protein G7046_g7092 [Stylonectria norvegica]
MAKTLGSPPSNGAGDNTTQEHAPSNSIQAASRGAGYSSSTEITQLDRPSLRLYIPFTPPLRDNSIRRRELPDTSTSKVITSNVIPRKPLIVQATESAADSARKQDTTPPVTLNSSDGELRQKLHHKRRTLLLRQASLLLSMSDFRMQMVSRSYPEDNKEFDDTEQLRKALGSDSFRDRLQTEEQKVREATEELRKEYLAAGMTPDFDL